MANKIKPYPHDFCRHCMLNGDYPWNTNPLLLCAEMEGLCITLLSTCENGAVHCSSFKLITENIWVSHLEDLKKESERKRELRLRVTTEI